MLHMKKAILPVLALFSILLFACKDKKKAEPNTGDVPLMNKTETTTTDTRTVLGKWKMVGWNERGSLLSEADKQKVMDSTEIEITNQGKWITRATGGERPVNYTYYENTRTISLPLDNGKMESFKVSFSGNQMTLTNEKGSMVLERKN